MRHDIENQLDSGHAYTTTAVTTNSYQKQTAAQDLSIGRMLSLLFIVTTAAGAGTTVTFDAVQADDTGLSTNLAVLNTVTALAAALPVGASIEVPFPHGSMTQLHLGGRVGCSGGTATITVDTYLMPSDEIPRYRSFPKVVDALV